MRTARREALAGSSVPADIGICRLHGLGIPDHLLDRTRQRRYLIGVMTPPTDSFPRWREGHEVNTRYSFPVSPTVSRVYGYVATYLVVVLHTYLVPTTRLLSDTLYHSIVQAALLALTSHFGVKM